MEAATSSNEAPETTDQQRSQKLFRSRKVTLMTLVRECSESPNPYLQKFASSPLAVLFLTNEHVIGCFGRKSRSLLRKELMEAAALEARMERIYTPSQQQKLVVWDLCSGKGFSAAWLSLNTYPNATIHLVDTDTRTNRDYLVAFPKLTYHNIDLYSDQLEDLIRTSCRDDNSKVLLVGIHLCGDLSRRALELRSRCGADAALVSPCCGVRQIKPKKRRPGSFGYNVPQVARQLKHVTPYDLWCWMLWGYARSTPGSSSGRHRRLDLAADPLMRTDKNKWLVVVEEETMS